MTLLVLALGHLAVVLLVQRTLARHANAGAQRPVDIGIFFCWVVAAYGAFPLVGIALANLGVGALHDGRLAGELPQLGAVQRVGVMYLLFLTGFAMCYVAVRNAARNAPFVRPAIRPTRADVWTSLALLASIKAGLFASRAVLGIEQGEDYLATYIELAGQPLLVQQLIGVLSATELSVSILVIVVVIGYRPRMHGWVGAILALQIVAAIAGSGSRSQAFSCALAYIVARSIFDQRMRYPFIVVTGGVGLLIFLVAGLLRQVKVSDEQVSGFYLLQGGEFLSVFYNSLDLAERLQDLDNTLFRVGLYFVDVVRLVPRQIVGDLKIDPAAFYAASFYPEFSDAGGGLAFGAISESTVGFGAIEALVRGSLVGVLYGLVARACLDAGRTNLRAFVYTWFVVLSYQAIRDTTFSVFPRFVFQVVPVLVVLRLTGALRSRPRKARSRPRSASSLTA